MRILRNESKIFTVALVLVLTMGALMAVVPAVNAAKIKTSAYIAVSPKIAGLGQSVLVNAFISPMPEAWRKIFEGIYVVFTTPDGTNVTRGPLTTEYSPNMGPGTGALWFVYTPDKLGNWTVKLTWAGDDTHEGVESELFKFTVQTEPLPGIPSVELPTGYWERPINAENREWYKIAGDWYFSAKTLNYNASGASYNPYSKAPETAHILWKHQPLIGGIVGGEFGDKYYQDMYYPSLNPVIMGGRVYFPSMDARLHCLDLRTGEELWTTTTEIPGATPGGTTMAWEIPLYASPDPQTYTNRDSPQPGTQACLYTVMSKAITKFCASTGAVLKIWTPFNTTNYTVSTFGATYFDVIAHCAYTQLSVVYTNGTTGSRLIKWDTIGTVRDMINPGGWMPSRLIWDVPYQSRWVSFRRVYGDVLIYMNDIGETPARVTGVSAKTGQELWVYESTDYVFNCFGCAAFGKLFWPDSVHRTIRAFDLSTGQQAWESAPAEYPYGAFWAYNMGSAYGKVYALCYDGYIYAYNATTGKTVWKFYSGDTAEVVYNTWPWWSGIAIADGKVYAGTSEHSPTAPFMRGCRQYCLDADTGEELWSIAFANGGGKAIADGTLVAGNEYDEITYAFDKGQTATTVEAPMTAITAGDTVVIQGTVTDQSPAQTGTAAIADEYMTLWMEYLHMQKARPTNATGVEVTIDAVDPNNNFVHIGTATSDTSGLYSYAWKTPDVPGKYTIIATFEGSKSYYSSYAETAMAVTEAPAATPTPTPAVDTTPTIIGTGIGTGIAIIIAIAIVGILLLRKK